ncbi:MMPL family transporter [Bacteriovorax sp. PP10]|uniref:MMPL family transporter n=1 Tax=Bacteriovorax antarcticus TaxID=3088717 RepID=A0ABU5VS14_9BACT|nr:MMPL family transporter [Bacteriovorax sp. PP10]MEA9355833.1 MMPL family transporter [Bacteriovorax sp. PP10]
MSILKWNLKHFYIMPVIAIIFSIWGAMQAPKLKVNMDLSGLLSDTNPAVVEMNHVSDMVGGGGYLIALVGPMVSPEKVLPQITETLKEVPRIKYSYYERETYSLKDKALFLISKKEFKQMLTNAQILFSDKKVDTTGLDLFGDGDQTEDIKDAKKFFSDLKTKIPQDRYFLSQDKKYAMLLIKPDFGSTDLDSSEVLIGNVNTAMAKKFGKKVPYQLSGRYVEKIEDKQQFDRDIAKTSIISTVLLIIVLFFGLGTMRAGWFTLAGVFMAMGQTVGLAYLFVGRINILTGFLLAILSGLGSEYGIHFVRRYIKERQSGKNKLEAIEETYLVMGRSLFSAALTSAAAFFILSISDFRGFSELGIIAGMGIVCIYFTFMCIFPLGARILPHKKEGHIQEKVSRFFYAYPFKTKHAAWCLILIPILGYGIYNAYFEYDFERLHNFSKKTQELNKLTDNLYGRAITPSAILTRDLEQVKSLETWLKSEENDEIIDQVISYNTLVPDDMQTRYSRIQKMKGKINELSPKEIEEKTQLSYEQVQRWLNTSPYGDELVPDSLAGNFGKDKNIILVYPKERQGTYDNINRYAGVLLKAKKLFPGMEVGSDTLVFSAILNHIIEDGKIVLVLFLVGAFFVFWPDFKNLRYALILEGQLIIGCLLLVALMGLFHEPFTILNVAIIPAVLAAGIDMGVHQIHDEIEHKDQPLPNPRKRGEALSAARRISGPVHLGMLTSICGFGALLFAEAKMLNGVGWISMMGQISMYLICMVLFPMLKDYVYSFKKK